MATRIAPLVFVAASLASVALPAQDWRTEQVADVRLEFDAPSRLERLPMQLGENGIYHRARLRPKDTADFVRAQYYWYCDVYEFSKKPKASDDLDLPEGLSPEALEMIKRFMSESDFKPMTCFKDWLDKKNQSTLTIEVAGKKKPGRRGKLDYQHWVWKEKSGFGPCEIVYCEAAVYTFPDSEVALVIEMPLETEKPGKPKSKWKNIIDRMIPSGKELEIEDIALEDDKKRDRFADSPFKKEALDAAKKNIQGLQGWDYFTTPNYVVLYSWDFEKPSERSKSKKDAEFYVDRLEKMRDLYVTNYPLDPTGTKAIMPDPASIPKLGGPITGVPSTPKEPEVAEGQETEAKPAEKLGTTPYSVFRLCATYDQFMKYGESPPGVVGWYSPSSKELVVFLGGDQMMGSGATETVTYHEGWHQFADFYFHHPETARYGELHRWFDEAHGDYFGSFRWGSQGWKYYGSKMRYDDCKSMVRAGDFVPWKDIVRWDRRRFYSARAPYYYAQAFSMIDFLRRGSDSRGWEPRWGEILDMYGRVMLVHGDSELAVNTAFRDFKDEDW
jgi:hypothetical protein